MELSPTFERTLTELDHVRITRLVQRALNDTQPSNDVLSFEDALDTATVVPSREVTPDVVTMYTQVMLRDAASGQRSEYTVCYPEDAEPESGFISVLSPLGFSLLGMRVGTTVGWPRPGGGTRQAEIVAILFQPEASGDYLM